MWKKQEKEDTSQAMEIPQAQLYWQREVHAGKSQWKGTGHGKAKPCDKTFLFSLRNEMTKA